MIPNLLILEAAAASSGPARSDRIHTVSRLLAEFNPMHRVTRTPRASASRSQAVRKALLRHQSDHSSGPAVSMRGPASVMAIVCSKWALGSPSAVTWSSGPRGADLLHAHVDHRFHGNHQPGPQAKITAPPEPLGDEIRHLRVFVHFAADSVSNKRFDDREPIVFNERLHFDGHFAPQRPFATQFNSQCEHPPSTSRSFWTLGSIAPTACVTAASPHQPFSLQPVSMLTMSPSAVFGHLECRVRLPR